MRNYKPIPRTPTQNKALHLAFTLLADRLNDAGLDQRTVLKPSISIPWSGASVKEQLFKPIMRAMLEKTSTTELDKQKEISDVWDMLLKHLGEKFNVEYLEFPHTEDGQIGQDGLIKINEY
jgi:hypothetical protein